MKETENRLLKGILEYFEDEVLVLADGFDGAVIGVDTSTMRIIYSVCQCIEILMEREGMNIDEAIEFFEFNVRGSYVGDRTPIWCEDMYYQ